MQIPLSEARDKIDELEGEISKLRQTEADQDMDIRILVAKVNKLEQCLKYYADKNHWPRNVSQSDLNNSILADRGKRARIALGK